MKWASLLFVLFLNASAVVADDESSSSTTVPASSAIRGVAPASNKGRASHEFSVLGTTQFTRPAIGMASYSPTGPRPILQSSKVSFGGSMDYRHWHGNNGLEATYSIVASDANFVSPGDSWRMSLMRHEGTISYVRRFFPYAKLTPYASLGAGAFVTHGGYGVWYNGTWYPQPHLGIDSQFEMRGAAGFDWWYTRHFGIRSGYVVHWLRAPNFSDSGYRGARTFITEPQVGLLWRF